jgi:hypothetical protein
MIEPPRSSQGLPQGSLEGFDVGGYSICGGISHEGGGLHSAAPSQISGIKDSMNVHWRNQDSDMTEFSHMRSHLNTSFPVP